MKALFIAAIFSVTLLEASLSKAQSKQLISGSDTLAGVMTDAIVGAGLTELISYVGGGSGVGEKALLNGEIGVTAMSREIKPEIANQLEAVGAHAVPYVLGLDGLGIFVNASSPLAGMDFSTLSRIFSCEIRTWDQVSGSGKVGPINAFRRNDQSGTTDTFKHLLGFKKFGDCVTVVNDTQDISERTSQDPNSIGFAGLSAKKEGNKTLAISRLPAGPFVSPNVVTIRNESYPLSRKLYIYTVTGARNANVIEAQLLKQLTDRSFMDPILEDHDFITLD